jgi:hypothetical protein
MQTPPISPGIHTLASPLQKSPVLDPPSPLPPKPLPPLDFSTSHMDKSIRDLMYRRARLKPPTKKKKKRRR